MVLQKVQVLLQVLLARLGLAKNLLAPRQVAAVQEVGQVAGQEGDKFIVIKLREM